MNIFRTLIRKKSNERGTAIVEYSLLLSMISCACFVCLLQLGTNMSLSLMRLDQGGLGPVSRGAGGGGGAETGGGSRPHPGNGGGSWGTGHPPEGPPPEDN